MARRAVNGPLPDYDLTGFALVTSFKLADGLHPVSYLWLGRHLQQRRWAPIPLLRYLVDNNLLTKLTISEIIFSDKQTDVWLPTPDCFPRYEMEFLCESIAGECKRISRIIIGKCIQGEASVEDETRRRKTAKLVLDPGELKFIIDDAVSKGIFYRQTTAKLSSGEPFGTIVEYFDNEMPQYVHLRSFMLGYVTINLLNMVNRFPDIAVRVATDSFYYDKKYHCDVKKYLGDNDSAWGGRRVKQEQLHKYREHADVQDKPEYHSDVIEKASTRPSIDDPIGRHRLIYLNGPGGCGKTTRVIELFRGSNLITLTPTHRLARDFHEKGITASTYHSFFRYSGGEWSPLRMGTKIIPDIFLWDEICTVSMEIVKMFLEWLKTKNTMIILCGDHGQPPPFTGLSPHCWLKLQVEYYEEMTIDKRSLDEELTALKASIRCTDSKNQGSNLRRVIPETSLEEFYDNWKPSDMAVASRKISRDILVKKLYQRAKEKFPHEGVPLCYRPVDTRKRNILVDIPWRHEQRELVLNDIVEVDLSVVDEAINKVKSPWRLGYATTIHSSQGLIITDTTMWIIDDFIEWDNLIYLAVSRVWRLNKLKRVAVTLKELL